MIAEFDLSRLGRAAAKFDDTQLRHWQKEAVAHLSNAQFLAWIADQLPPGLSEAQLQPFVDAIRHNVEFPADAKQWADVVFGKLTTYSDEARAAIRDATPSFFATASEAFAQFSEFKLAARDIGQKTARKGPALYMPLRAALTGVTHGPELGPLLPLLSREEVQARFDTARRAAE
jgi:glutamyl-tRNA synthetase